jgi:hypothetical protein
MKEIEWGSPDPSRERQMFKKEEKQLVQDHTIQGRFRKGHKNPIL